MSLHFFFVEEKRNQKEMVSGELLAELLLLH